ncbi:MAG: hypothetical protein NC089_07115 [Bacteroides sp.]|nr:hypothetical protein [Bacteroides sp.]MCM1548380.1 hypothetical protein [Clostridium sp.]
MFQKEVLKKEDAAFKKEERIENEHLGIRMSLDSNDVRVVQCIKLSPRQIQAMVRERIVKRINYSELAMKILQECIPEADYISFLYYYLKDELDKINMASFSSAEEIEENYNMLLERLNHYIDENWPQLLRKIQTELNAIRYADRDVEVEETEELIVYHIIYHTEELRAFCEADSEIMGTIHNLSNNYHRTPQRERIDGRLVLHQHVTNRTAIAFCKNGNDTIEIMAYGEKSDSAQKGSGGYKWDEKPK